MVFWENKEEEAVFALGMMWDEEKEWPKKEARLENSAAAKNNRKT